MRTSNRQSWHYYYYDDEKLGLGPIASYCCTDRSVFHYLLHVDTHVDLLVEQVLLCQSLLSHDMP